MICDILSASMLAAVSHSDGASIAGTDGGSALEYTISLGNLLTIGSFLVFVTIYIVNSRGAAKILGARLEIVDASMEDFRKELKEFSKILISQERQDGRIDLLGQQFSQQGQRVDELSRSLGEFKNMMLQDVLKRPTSQGRRDA